MYKKRGQLSTLQGAIELVFAAFITIALYLVLVNLLDTQTEQQVRNNIEGFLTEIRSLVEGSKTTISFSTTPLNLPDSYILVGFNKEQATTQERCGPEDETIYKPQDPACYQQSCLCVYENTAGNQDFGKDTKLTFCTPLPVDEIFTYRYTYSFETGTSGVTQLYSQKSPYQNLRGGIISRAALPSHYYDIPEAYQPFFPGDNYYSEFLIHGTCDQGLPFKVQQLNLDLLHYNNKKYLFVTVDPTRGYKERKQWLEQFNQASTSTSIAQEPTKTTEEKTS